MTQQIGISGVAEHDPMTLATTPRQREFVAFLQAISDMTEDDLAAALALCPPVVMDLLTRGPLAYRYACGVCEAFGGRAFHGHTPDVSDPLWRAWGYHEVPKLHMRRADDRHYGRHANDTYERCIATYRAAGWDGEAAEPNA